MSAPTIRGWCPSAYKPMASGDGLVVRVKPPMGELTPVQARGLAGLAEQLGNGLIDLTSRANLQIRGVGDEGHADLIEGLGEVGLLDDDAGVEARRNIITDPFCSGEDRTTQDDTVRHLTEGLRDPEFARLPSKFGFVIDTGEERQLADVSGDIRIERGDGGLIVRADGMVTGRPASNPEEATNLALDLTRWFIASRGVGTDGRGRMAKHVASGARLPLSLSGDAVPNRIATPPEPGPFQNGQLIGAAFGQLTPNDLFLLSEAASPLRITPWRMVFLPGLTKTDGLHDQTSLVITPNDPRLRVFACTGATGCPQATVKTRTIAHHLAPHVPENATLHVSGCAKGCAHPNSATFSLVGRDGRFDLVRDGRPWDDPVRRGIDPSQVVNLING